LRRRKNGFKTIGNVHNSVNRNRDSNFWNDSHELSSLSVRRDHDEKKCKNNDDNNCNDKHKTQKINAKNECEIENYNKDHSKDNENLNELTCVNDAQNLNDVFEELLVEDGVGDEVA
jgi:hypothetical protein